MLCAKEVSRRGVKWRGCFAWLVYVGIQEPTKAERERERKICIYREREKPGSWLLQFTHWGCGEYKHNIHTNSHKKSNAMLYKKERGGKSEQ